MSDTIQAGDPREWQRPPDDELGVLVPLSIEFARTDVVAFAAVGFVAYSVGFTFQLSLRKRIPVRGIEGARGDTTFRGSWPWGLGFDIEFADGRQSRNEGGVFPGPPEPPGRTIVILQRAGGGAASFGQPCRRWRSDMWVGPLPPPGSFSFVYEWPAEGIELTRREIDAQPIIDAAGRSTSLW